jgi:hypothetical protein
MGGSAHPTRTRAMPVGPWSGSKFATGPEPGTIRRDDHAVVVRFHEPCRPARCRDREVRTERLAAIFDAWLLMLGGQRSCQLTERFLMSLVVDL